MLLNLHNVLLWKKMIIYTTGENFAIIDQHPNVGGGGGGGGWLLPINNAIEVHWVPKGAVSDCLKVGIDFNHLGFKES